MKKSFFPALLILTLAMISGGVLVSKYYENPNNEGGEVHGSTGSKSLRKAPLFELADASGKSTSLVKMRGDWVVLHFWASWCQPCLEEIPHWAELSMKSQDQPVKWVAISLDEDWEEVFRVVPKEKWPSTIILLKDGSLKVANQYGSYQFPETYLISPNGEIVKKWVGPQNWLKMDIAAELKLPG